MNLYAAAPAVLAIPLFLYVWFYIRRMFVWYRRASLSPAQYVFCVAAAMAVTLPALDIWGLWALAVFHAAAIALTSDLIRLLLETLFRRHRRIWYGICSCGLIPVVGTGLVLCGGFLNMRRIVKTEYTVFSAKELRSGGYRVVFLSDLHFETTMNVRRLEALCQEIEDCGPDLVILGGDIVDERTSESGVRAAFAAFSQIDSSFGVYYVYGNHDKGRYSADCDFTAEDLAKAAQSAGVHILEDETCVLNGELTLTGRRDRTDASREGTKRVSAGRLLQDADEDAYHILADHQPRYTAACAAAGYDLMLSGHTHGGQIWPTGQLMQLTGSDTVLYGREAVDEMELIVSSGAGGWRYPFRTGSRSEYVVVNIRS